MTTIGTKMNLVDLVTRLDPDLKVAPIAEILAETNEILDDMIWQEGNLLTGHRYTRRVGLPSATWRKLNQGVIPGKSATEQEDASCAMLEAYSECDKELADLNGNTSAFRASEASGNIESISQEFADKLFYGNLSSAPEQFKGLANYFNAASTVKSNIGYNVIKAGGVGDDNTSLWLIGWSPRSIFGIYPKGSVAGLKFEDKGQVTLGDATYGYYEGYRSHFQWKCGIAIPDWRYVVRIANIDVSALSTFGSGSDTSANLLDLMVQAYHKIPHIKACKPVWYCNGTVATWLDIMAMNKSNVRLGIKEFDGMDITSFRQIPVKKCDAILDSESLAS